MEEQQKLVPLGYIILQSFPVTEEEGEAWETLFRKCLPPEACKLFTQVSWVPIMPGDSN